MKKIFFIMAVIAIKTQTTSAQGGFGITAGVVSSNYSAKYEDLTISLKSKVGLTFGVMGNLPLSKSFSFQPGVNYVQKGASVSSDGDKATIKLNYIEAPLNFVYNAPEKNGHFYAGAGPSLAYGISAKTTANGVEEKGHFGSGPEDVAKPFEIGANVLAGYQFAGGVNIAVNYNRGLNNISSDGSTKEHNYYFGLRVGYMLSGKK